MQSVPVCTFCQLLTVFTDKPSFLISTASCCDRIASACVARMIICMAFPFETIIRSLLSWIRLKSCGKASSITALWARGQSSDVRGLEYSASSSQLLLQSPWSTLVALQLARIHPLPLLKAGLFS